MGCESSLKATRARMNGSGDERCLQITVLLFIQFSSYLSLMCSFSPFVIHLQADVPGCENMQTCMQIRTFPLRSCNALQNDSEEKMMLP